MNALPQSCKTEFGDAFTGHRVLVTGATGFIGWHLCNELNGMGAEVHALSRSAAPASVPDGCRSWAVDVTDADALRKAVAGSKPQTVFHLASFVDGRQRENLVMPMLQANLIGSVHLAQVCHDAAIANVVAVGSSEEPEDDARDQAPLSPYAAAKAGATLYFRMFHRAYGLPVVILRPTLTYGPRQAPDKLIPHALAMLMRGAPPTLATAQRLCDFVFVMDVVRGLCRAAMAKDQYGRTFDLGTGVGTRIGEAIELLAELTGRRVEPTFESAGDRLGHDGRIADVVRTTNAIGWRPAWTLREGLTATINAFQQQMTVPS